MDLKTFFEINVIHSQVLNQIVSELPTEHPLAESRPLRELLGHTPLQVCLHALQYNQKKKGIYELNCILHSEAFYTWAMIAQYSTGCHWWIFWNCYSSNCSFDQRFDNTGTTTITQNALCCRGSMYHNKAYCILQCRVTDIPESCLQMICVRRLLCLIIWPYWMYRRTCTFADIWCLVNGKEDRWQLTWWWVECVNASFLK